MMDGPMPMSTLFQSSTGLGEREALLLLRSCDELMSRMNYLFLWLSDGANIGTMQQAAAIVSSSTPLKVLKLMSRSPSVSVGEKLPVPCKLKASDVIRDQLMFSAIGNIIIAAAITANGTIGSRHHIPFSIAARASMGFYFSYFAVVSRLVLGLVYFGYVVYFLTRCKLTK
jgi:NCS1 family nucleobase:cation symporter-1